jgi:pimeloyl-ACP methyl ester carboxylesterase
LIVTVVLVHGNPETDAVWDPLVDALGRTDVVRLSPPGIRRSAVHWLLGNLSRLP